LGFIVFRPVTQAEVLGQLHDSPRQFAQSRVPLAGHACQRGAVRDQQARDIGVEGGVGEVVLQLGGGYGDLGIEQCRVQRRDTVADAGRPPAPQPVPDCQVT